MAANAFLTFFDKADGESIQKGMERWVEIQGWSWEVDADSSWTKGGGASVGKPTSGAFSFEHAYDSSSHVIMGFMCAGTAFPQVQVQMKRTTGAMTPETYLTITMDGAFITKVANAGTEEGTVIQRVDLVFKAVKIDYRPQDSRSGKIGAAKTFTWDIPAGTASPSS
jgi:type VI secretion system secreted protein Hcp